MNIEFTDEELQLIGLALNKVDPTDIITAARTAKEKIRQYAETQMVEQADAAAKKAVGED